MFMLEVFCEISCEGFCLTFFIDVYGVNMEIKMWKLLVTHAESHLAQVLVRPNPSPHSSHSLTDLF